MSAERGLGLPRNNIYVLTLSDQTRAYYTEHYKPRTHEKSPFSKNGEINLGRLDSISSTNDSPAASRRSILQRLAAYQKIYPLTDSSVVLDLGAGRQILEVEFEATNADIAPQFKIITLDIANITQDQLLIPRYFPDAQSRYRHLQADGSNLLFADNTIDAALSNMALDFMPENARKELFRVLRNGAPVFLNLHHLSGLSSNIDYLLKKLQRRMIRKMQFGGKPSKSQEQRLSVLKHDKFLRDNNVLFSNPQDIRKAFEKYGFVVTSIEEAQNDIDKWWEVDMVKPDNKGLK